MPRSRFSIEKIRAELTWAMNRSTLINAIVAISDAARKTGHAAGACTRPMAAEVWTYRQEYFCEACREYTPGGSKVFAGPRTS